MNPQDVIGWIVLSRKTRAKSWWKQGQALEKLQHMAAPFRDINLKIHVTRGVVDWHMASNLKDWEGYVLCEFIQWHRMRGPNYTLNILSGQHVNSGELWDEFKRFAAAGAQGIILDAGSKPENIKATVATHKLWRLGINVISEAYGMGDDGNINPLLYGLDLWCNWKYYNNHLLNYTPPSNAKRTVMLRRYASRFNIPDPTLQDMEEVSDKGFVVSCSYFEAVRMGLIGEDIDQFDLEDDDDE